VVVFGVQASITQSAGQLSLSLLFPSSHVSPAFTVPLPQSGGCVVVVVEVEVLVLVVGTAAVVVGPCVLELVDVDDVVVGTVVLEVDELVVVVSPTVVVVTVVDVGDVATVVLELDDDVVDVVTRTLVLLVDGVAVEVVVGATSAQRSSECHPVLTVRAHAPPVSTVPVPVDSRARGLRMTASTLLCAPSFTWSPPTSNVGDEGPTDVSFPRTRSPVTATVVGAPGANDSEA
jgi:hypothetical protein